MGWVLASVSAAVSWWTLVIVRRQEARRRGHAWWAGTPQIAGTTDDSREVRVIEIAFMQRTVVASLRLVGAEVLSDSPEMLRLTGVPHGIAMEGERFRFLAASDDWEGAWVVISDSIPGAPLVERWAWMSLDQRSRLPVGSAPRVRWHRAGHRFVRIPRVAEIGPGGALIAAVTQPERSMQSLTTVLRQVPGAPPLPEAPGGPTEIG